MSIFKEVVQLFRKKRDEEINQERALAKQSAEQERVLEEAGIKSADTLDVVHSVDLLDRLNKALFARLGCVSPIMMYKPEARVSRFLQERLSDGRALFFGISSWTEFDLGKKTIGKTHLVLQSWMQDHEGRITQMEEKFFRGLDSGQNPGETLGKREVAAGLEDLAVSQGYSRPRLMD